MIVERLNRADFKIVERLNRADYKIVERLNMADYKRRLTLTFRKVHEKKDYYYSDGF